ncbi:MAG: ABC transporter substrate-binding protein [Gammaproteobacteria bacterium]
MSTAVPRTTLLLNWYANPYHTPIFIAKAQGYYQEAGINLAILETTDPSDVTEIVGRNIVDIGLKAMVHCYAARDRNYPVKSIGTLLDEPATGLIFLKSSNIKSFDDIRGKKVGYVGEFGKVMIDDLAKQADIDSSEYETVRTGMNVAHAISQGIVDTGIGIGNFQQIELEHLCGEETGMLRIDELAGLGCCCFCSVLYIVNEETIAMQPEMLKNFMRATQRATAYTIENPEKAFAILCEQNPRLNTELYHKIFISSLPYFSRDLKNVARDWEKVGRYSAQLGITPEDHDPKDCYTNEFVPTQAYASMPPLSEEREGKAA